MSMKSNKELWATAMRAALRVEFITNMDGTISVLIKNIGMLSSK